MATKKKIIAIKVKISQSGKEEIWKLCNKNYSYCPAHGKCPNILDYIDESGEHIKLFGTELMFYCHKCKMVKAVNIWNNSIGITEAIEELYADTINIEAIK